MSQEQIISKQKFSIKNYQFKPSLGLSILALAVFVFLLSLGFWQLNRAEQKKQIIKEFQQKAYGKPLTLQQLQANNIQYQRIHVQGFYDNKHQILLDNKTYKGHVGYDVVTPLIIPNNKQVVLINRGWIPLGKSRAQLPTIKPVIGKQNIVGLIKSDTNKAIILKKEQLKQNIHWPIRMQSINIATVEKLLKKPVYPFIIMLDKNQPHGFVRQWKPVVMPVHKHVGYAVQWFALALTLLIIYIVLSFRRKK